MGFLLRAPPLFVFSTKQLFKFPLLVSRSRVEKPARYSSYERIYFPIVAYIQHIAGGTFVSIGWALACTWRHQRRILHTFFAVLENLLVYVIFSRTEKVQLSRSMYFTHKYKFGTLCEHFCVCLCLFQRSRPHHYFRYPCFSYFRNRLTNAWRAKLIRVVCFSVSCPLPMRKRTNPTKTEFFCAFRRAHFKIFTVNFTHKIFL